MNQYATGQSHTNGYQFSSVSHTPPQGTPRQRVAQRVSQAGDLMKGYIAEAVGSFTAVAPMLLLMMYLSVFPDQISPWYLIVGGLWIIFTVGMMIGMTIFMGAGGLNPTVTLLMLLRKRIGGKMAASLIAGQLTGWLLAGFLLSFIHVGEVNKEAFQISFHSHGIQIGSAGLNERAQAINFGMPKPNPVLPDDAFPTPAKFVVEVFLASILLGAVVLCKRRPAKPIVTAVTVGSTVGFGVGIGMFTSGGALNPLVWTMASVLDWSLGSLEQFLLYFVGPLTAVLVVFGITRLTE